MDKLIRMHLVMALGSKVLDRMEVDTTIIEDNKYLEACCIVLQKRHWLTVATYHERPEFYLETAAPVQGQRKKHRLN